MSAVNNSAIYKMDRFINLNNIGPKSKARIRKNVIDGIFGLNTTNTKYINQLANSLGASSGNDLKKSYAFFGDIYNDVLNQKRKEIAKKKRAELAKVYVSTTLKFTGYFYKQGVLKVGKKTEKLIHSKNKILKKNIASWVQSKVDEYTEEMEADSPFDKVGGSASGTTSGGGGGGGAGSSAMFSLAALDIDHGVKNDIWDKKRNMCVPDFIQFRYMNRKGFIKKLKANGTQEEKDLAVQHYCTMQYNDCHYSGVSKSPHAEWQDPNIKGYTINHLIQFAENFDLNLYALCDGKIINEYNTPNNKKNTHPALVFEIKNNHLYPILDPRATLSWVMKAKKLKKNIVSDSERKSLPTQADEEFKKNIIFRDEETKDLTCVQYAMEKMEECGTQTHYPTNLKLFNDSLNQFQIGDNRYVLTGKDDYLTNAIIMHCEKKGIAYKGQNAPSFTHGYCQEWFEKNHSYFNSAVREVLYNKQVKDRCHYGAIGEMNKEFIEKYKTAKCIDIRKCYRQAMENAPDDFFKITFEDTIKHYYGEAITYGLYYVETDDLTLMHKSNWYSHLMVEAAQELNEKGVADIDFKIKYVIKGTRIHKGLKNIIEEIDDDIDDEDFKKSVVNSIYGYTAKTTSSKLVLQIDTDINNVWNDYAKDKGFHNDKLLITKYKTSTGREMYAYGNKYENQLLINNLPVAIQIQDTANINLYNMIKRVGGECLWRKTDCAIIHDAGDIDDKLYRLEDDIKKPDIEDLKPERHDRHFNYELPARNWKYLAECDSDEWLSIADKLYKNKGGMILGRPGVGKSYCCIQAMKHFEKFKLKSQALAFTNKATHQLHGSTIHKFFHIDKNNKIDLKWARDVSSNIDVIFVDEISMINSFLWQLLCELKQISGIIFILIGDYRQLPPVVISEVELHEVDLQDTGYELLDDFLSSRHSCSVDDMINGMNLCYKHTTRKSINRQVQSKLSNAFTENEIKRIDYIPDDGDKQKNKLHQDSILFKGAKLLLNCTIKEDKQILFAKNESVIVDELTDNTFKIIKDDKAHEFKFDDFHKQFILGYATTYHKSQGDTYPGRINIFDTEFIRKFLTNEERGVNWFEHDAIFKLCNGVRCELTQMKRYDIKLWNIIEELWASDCPAKRPLITAISRATMLRYVKIIS